MIVAAEAIPAGPGLGWLIAAAGLIALATPILLFGVFLRWGRQGKAMVRTGLGARRVAIERLLVIPGLQELHWVDLTLKRIEISCRGEQALAARGGEPIELRACFLLRLRPAPESILAACDRFGLDAAGDEAVVRNAFAPACQAALAEVLAQYGRDDLLGLQHQGQIRERLAGTLAGELTDGYVLDSVAVEFFEPVAPEQLADRDNTE